MKSKVLSVVRYTVEKSIRNKWFVILNALLLIATVIGLNFNTISTILKSNDISFGKKLEIIVEDKENLIYEKLEQKLSTEDVTLTKQENTVEYTKENVTKDQVVIIVEKQGSDIKTKVISQEGINSKYYDVINSSVKEAKEELFAKDNNIPIEKLSELSKEPEVQRIMLGVNNEDADKKFGMQAIFNYIIFFILLLILSKIANDISQEKISKSIEYVLTCISAKMYLVAKVLSINLTFIIQMIFTLIYTLIGTFINSLLNMYILGPSLESGVGNMDLSMISNFVDTNLVIYFVVTFIFLILTVLILSVIQAILSSKTTNISEAGNATVLLIMLNLVLYLLSNFFITPLKAPGVITYILSCIPIVSMYFIPTMILIGQATVIQVAIASLLLIVSVCLAFKYGANMFKNGVLDYSKKSNKKKEEKYTPEVEEQIIIKNEYSKIGYVLGFAVLLFILLQIGLPYILALFINPIHNILNGAVSISNISSIINMFSFILSLVVPSLFVYSYVDKEKKKDEKKNKNIKEKINIQKHLKYVLICMPLVLLTQIVIGYILEKLGLNYNVLDKVSMYDQSSTFSKILFFVTTAILPAIFEELFVRKAILNFTKKYGTVFAVISSSLLFAVIHLNLSQMLFAFIMGIILSIITLKTKSIIPAGIVHLLNNGYAALTMIFEHNHTVLTVINVIYIVLIAIGVLLIISLLIKNKGKIKILEELKLSKKSNNEIENDRKQPVYKKYRYILCDYTFLVSCILCVVLLFAMEKILTIL